MLNSLSEKLVSYVSPSSDGGHVGTDNVVERIQPNVDSNNGGKQKRCHQAIDVDLYSPCVKRRRIEEGFVQKVTNSVAKMAEWLVHSTNYLLGRLDEDPHYNLSTIQEQSEELDDEEQENSRHVMKVEKLEGELAATDGGCRFRNLPNTKRTMKFKMQHPENNEYLHRPPIHDRPRLSDHQQKRQFNGNTSSVRFLYSSQSQKVSSQSSQIYNGGGARYLTLAPQVRVNNGSSVRNVSLSQNKLYSLPCHTKVRNDVCNVVLRKPHMNTAAQCVRLEEKERYRQLIQQFSRTDSIHKEKDFPSIPCQTSTSSVASQESKSEEGLKIDLPPMVTVASNESSLSEMPLPKHRIVFSDKSQSQSEPEEISSGTTSPKSSSPPPCTRLKSNPYLAEDWVTQLVRRYSASTREQKRKIEEEQMKIKIFEEKRKTQDEKLDEEIQNRLRLSEKEPAILEEEIEKAPSLPKITPAMKAEIESALKPQPLTEVLVEGFRIQIKRQDMNTLAGLNWLNDEVINFYMSLLMERSQTGQGAKVHSFNTFFYPKLQSSGYDGVRRWTRKVDIFAVKYLLIPVHLGMHWCLAVVNFAEKTICYYDSMGGKDHQCLDTIKKYLCDESLDKKKKIFHLIGWTTKIARDVPHQMNGSDCGMFACKYADYITREIPISFTQADMPQFRQLMVYEILKKKLLT